MDRDLQKKGCPMTTKIFVNLAVKDLDGSKAFFRQLGFTFPPYQANAGSPNVLVLPFA